MNNNKLTKTLSRLLAVVLTAGLLNACSSGGDSTPPPSISIANASVTEGNSGTASLEFTVTASRAVGAGATVQYSTSNGTATAGTDYTANSGTLTIPQNSTTATLTILVNGDTLLETDETLTVTLSSPSNLTLGTTTATGTITNDDATTFNGYFSGSATVNTSVNITDLIGLAYDNRLMLFSRSGVQNVLYDITAITNTTGNAYTGAVAMYSGAAGAQTKLTTTADLTINGSTISGTLNAASGLGNGTFTITFDTANNVGATLGRIEGNAFTLWLGNLYGYDIDTLQFGAYQDQNGFYFGRDDSIQKCQYSSTLAIPDLQLNIYQLAHDIVDPAITTGCASPYVSIGHTGLAAVITTTTTDDTLVYAFSNGNIALFAVLKHYCDVFTC